MIRAEWKSFSFFFLFYLVEAALLFCYGGDLQQMLGLQLLPLAFLVRSSVKKRLVVVWNCVGATWWPFFWGLVRNYFVFFNNARNGISRGAIIWVRFPVFAAACAFWLGKDKNYGENHVLFNSTRRGSDSSLMLLAELYSLPGMGGETLALLGHTAIMFLATTWPKSVYRFLLLSLPLLHQRSRHGNWAFLFSLVTLPFSIFDW